LSDEEQALYEELEREAKGGVVMPDHADEKVVDEPAPPIKVAEKPAPQRESSVPATPAAPDKRRSEPEPG